MEKQKDGIWIIDVEGQTVYANQRMAEILGTSPPEMIGHSSFDYVFPEDVLAAESLFAAKKRAMSTGSTSSYAARTERVFKLTCRERPCTTLREHSKG